MIDFITSKGWEVELSQNGIVLTHKVTDEMRPFYHQKDYSALHVAYCWVKWMKP